jgi:glutamyl-tRNA synthetase
MRMSAEEIYPDLRPFVERGLDELRPLIELYKIRSHTLKEMADQMAVYFADEIAYEPEAVKKHVKGDDLAERMRALRDALAAVEPFDVAASERALRALAEQRGLGAAKFIHPLRLALTGKGASPPIFDVAAVLGKEKTLARLDRFIERLPSLA